MVVQNKKTVSLSLLYHHQCLPFFVGAISNYVEAKSADDRVRLALYIALKYGEIDKFRCTHAKKLERNE